MKLTVLPLTPERWPDLEALFTAKGCSIARMCWCMAYRQSGAQAPPPPGTTRTQVNRAGLKALVDAGRPPGLIGYRGKVPVGWVSLGPREEFAKLARSPVMKPVDDQPVWSVICFVVPAPYRGQGVAKALLAGAVAYARKQGARLIEAYPVDRRGRQNDENLWFGTKSMYDEAGFQEVARRKPRRPVVRLATGQPGRPLMPAKRSSSKPIDTDSYLAALPPDQRSALEKVRKAIRAAAPRAEECISYSLPAFKLGGKPLAAFGASARHCSFYPMSGSTLQAFEDELAGYEVSKGTVRFTPAKPLPATLVRRIVKARMAELGSAS